MNPKTIKYLRTISYILALVVVLMYSEILPGAEIVEEFWTITVAYVLLLVTLK